MPTYKLLYFNARGLGEAARLIFAYAGQPYEDYRIRVEDWPTVKPTTPCGQAPVLEVDGKRVAQSNSICRYLGKQFGLVADSDLDQARGDMIVDFCNDMRSPLGDIVPEKDEKKKKAMVQQFMTEHLPKCLEILEKLLKENNCGDGFFVGKSITWTDFMFYNNYQLIKSKMEAPEEFWEKYTKLNDLCERIEAIPSVAQWIKERPT